MKVVRPSDTQEEAQKQFREINERLAGYSLRAAFSHPLHQSVPALLTAWSVLPWSITGAYGGLSGFITRGTADQFPQLRQPVHKAL